MRNLKKILALVLALVMSMSLVTVANAFSDDESINEAYQEAAEVLAGLKVLQGRPDGSFDPKASVTRGEMAAIIYRIVTTDVEDKQTSIYAESSKLSDVPGTWSAGYVGFCNNSNLIMGYPDNTFLQNKTVTGHEALAMLLRAIGYGKNGEFVGKDWAINTAIYAKMNGLLKDINESTLSQPATREMVAQMTFLAMVAENVNWSLGLNYQPNGKTLADGFNLKAFEGVITANEYADLYDVTPVKAGKTVLDNDVTYTWTTDLTQMGMNYRGWSCGNDNTVIFNEETGNEVAYDGGEAKEVKKVGMNTADAEYFEEFGTPDFYVSDYRIEYVLKDLELSVDLDGCEDYEDYGYASAAAYADAKLKALFEKYAEDPVVTGHKTVGDERIAYATFERAIKAGADIDAYDMACMQLIFREADKEDASFELGEVYVGTKSVVGKDDISDEISWKEFVSKYINANTTVKDYTATNNGEWLKVIDNDGDSKADYVFRTRFVVDRVMDINKKGDITFYDLDSDDWDKVVMPEDLAEGDVVLWTAIDGIAYVTIPENFQATVKTYSWKNDTITTKDDETFGQSGILKSNYDDSLEEIGVWTQLKSAADDCEYVFYKDHFGYVAAFDQITVSNELKLLVDGFYDDGYNKKDIYKVEFWDSEAKDYAVAGVNTKTSDEDEFIDDARNGVKDGWERLIGVKDAAYKVETNKVTKENSWTNVAAVGLDGDTASVQNVDAKSNKNTTKTVALDWTNGVKAGTDGFAAQDMKLLSAMNGWENGEQTEILTNASTVYYYVYFDGDDMYVTEVVGRKNSLKVEDVLVDDNDTTVTTDDTYMIHGAYAVATKTNAYADDATAYPVADVVVVEVNRPLKGAESLSLVYSVDQRTNGEVRGVETINNGEDKPFSLYGDWTDAQYKDLDAFKFYNMIGKDNKATEADLVTNYAANGIYAGTINATHGIYDGSDEQWIDLADGTELEVPGTTPVFTFKPSTGKTNEIKDMVEGLDEDMDNGDKIIWVKNAAGKLLYIVNVSDSHKELKNGALGTLWTAITGYKAADTHKLTVKFLKQGAPATVFDTKDFNVKDGEIVTLKDTDGYEIVSQNGSVSTVKAQNLSDDSWQLTMDGITGDVIVEFLCTATAYGATMKTDPLPTGVSVTLDGSAFAASATINKSAYDVCTLAASGLAANQTATFTVKTVSGKIVTVDAAGKFTMPAEAVEVEISVTEPTFDVTVKGENLKENYNVKDVAKGSIYTKTIEPAAGYVITKLVVNGFNTTINPGDELGVFVNTTINYDSVIEVTTEAIAYTVTFDNTTNGEVAIDVTCNDTTDTSAYTVVLYNSDGSVLRDLTATPGAVGTPTTITLGNAQNINGAYAVVTVNGQKPVTTDPFTILA